MPSITPLQLLDRAERDIREARRLLDADRRSWPWERKAFAFLRWFRGRDDGLDYEERQVAAIDADYDPRGTAGFWNGSNRCLEWVPFGAGRARLTEHGSKWVERIALKHPDWD